jgi:hypothetical protein
MLRRSTTTGCVLFLLLVVAGCGLLPDEDLEWLQGVVADLHAEDMETREVAYEQLTELGDRQLSKKACLYALEAAAAEFPALEKEWHAPASALIEVAVTDPEWDHIAAVRAHFAAYSPAAKDTALNLLASTQLRSATEAYVELIAGAESELERLPTGTLGDEPRHAGVLFPRLLEHINSPQLQWDICLLTLDYLQSSAMPEQVEADLVAVFVPLVRELRLRMLALQEEGGAGWMWSDAYQAGRPICGLATDVLGHLGGDEVRRELEAGRAHRDPKLKMFAVLGLLRAGLEVGEADLVEVAASAEVRNWLWRELEGMGRSDLFPAAYATQAALAEGEMVDWLVYPTELARVPDEIQLMAVIPQLLDEGEAEFYVFRYRTLPPHWAAEDGWMAGVAGPFFTAQSPSPEAYGGTFSTFEAWGSKSAEEHLQAVRGLLQESPNEAQE